MPKGKEITGDFLTTRRLIWFFMFIFQLVLQSCSAFGREPMVYHSFEFDLRHESPGIDVLDYQYGDGKQIGTRMYISPKDPPAVERQSGTTGNIPRGEFLYVKWRINATGEIYEDRVDLRNRLPTDITDYTITFFMKGPQLYVYLISPESDRRPKSWQKGPIRLYSYLKQYQIYPVQPNWPTQENNTISK